MKIAILTLPIETNYGGILQAFALQNVLEKMGHQALVLDQKKYWTLPLWKKPLSYCKRGITKYLLGKDNCIFIEERKNKNYAIISVYTRKFIDKYIQRKIVDFNRLNELNSDDFDAFIVGSDQIWRPKYFCAPIENAFLSFTRGWNVKRISYAASFGTDQWEYSSWKTRNCSKLLKAFDAVSVREYSAVALCKTKFNVDAKWVLDPTMLLTSLDYQRLLKIKSHSGPQGQLFCYILDKTPITQKWLEKILDTKKLLPFEIKVENSASDNVETQLPVETWIDSFINAEYIFTDSFHACVFSILFNKPFIVFGNEERGLSRIRSLLACFHLQERLVTAQNNFDVLDSIPDVLPGHVKSILEEKRQYSLKFLEHALKTKT